MHWISTVPTGEGKGSTTKKLIYYHDWAGGSVGQRPQPLFSILEPFVHSISIFHITFNMFDPLDCTFHLFFAKIGPLPFVLFWKKFTCYYLVCLFHEVPNSCGLQWFCLISSLRTNTTRQVHCTLHTLLTHTKQ